MKDEIKTYLHDIKESCIAIQQFTANIDFAKYSSDDMIHSAVERKFEIIGEALVKIRDEAEDTFPAIRNSRSIISFRNILIHGYSSIDDRIVWDVIKTDLDVLMEDIRTLLDE
jgi:uncharacterized protein with HEPN domain